MTIVLLLHCALHMGESQLTMQTFALGSFDDDVGHSAGHFIFLRKHGLFFLGQVFVSP
jgi:hypothetical protein